MRLLVRCTPRAGVDPRREIAPRSGEEISALMALRADGLLLEAYSPGGPGAVLILEAERDRVDEVLARLPLVRDGVVETEITELHPFAGLTERDS